MHECNFPTTNPYNQCFLSSQETCAFVRDEHRVFSFVAPIAQEQCRTSFDELRKYTSPMFVIAVNREFDTTVKGCLAALIERYKLN
ncbi:hypothetical protein Tco_0196849, partial [Tanacetum coccineum]